MERRRGEKNKVKMIEMATEGKKIDRGEIKKVGSDEVGGCREENAHTKRGRGKGKCADTS